VRSKIAFVMLMVLLASCGAALDRQHVEERFRSLFACATPKVSGEYGGYLVQGCGVTAHFQCFESARAYDRRHNGGILGAALATDTCVLEHSERAPRPRAEATVARSSECEGPVRLKARALVRGGNIEATALPGMDREHVVLSVHSIPRLGDEPCRVDLFRDGSPLDVLQVRRVGDHEVRMAIRAESLRDLDQAQRLAGHACGFEFELGPEGLKTLSLLEVRFREELAHTKAVFADKPEPERGEGPHTSAKEPVAQGENPVP
jgi:hypothetical protein